MFVNRCEYNGELCLQLNKNKKKKKKQEKKEVTPAHCSTLDGWIGMATTAMINLIGVKD